MKLNMQAPEHRHFGPQYALKVIDIWKTIQGEGIFAGTPAIFIRLAGCNLRCNFCDTDYTTGAYYLEEEHILHKVRHAIGTSIINLVVITGGEPLRQNLGPLLNLLTKNNFLVQIETNGTYSIPDDFPPGIFTICSPKTPKLAKDLEKRVSAFKYVIEADRVDPKDGLPISVLGMPVIPARPSPDYKGPIYVQPADEQDPYQNERNMNAAIKSCLTFGYILSVQVHKIAGLR